MSDGNEEKYQSTPDQIRNSPYCQSYNSYNDNSEN